MRARSLRHEHHKVPVTALAYSSPHVLLAGEGTHLAAYSCSDRREYLGGARIFRSQAIHKILINETTGHILVYGGSHVAFVTFSQSSEGLVEFVVVAQQDIGDWIFDAAFSPTPAHGALAGVALVTAHNAFIRCTLRSCQDDSDLASISTETLVSGSNCILYCAHVSWLSASSCLVASGTAFGDIIIWSTSFDSSTRQDSNTKTHYIYQAHEGSVFGVQVSRYISQETLGGPSCVLASCSDDRTVRLWDISHLEHECPSLTEIQRETGFGSTDESNAYAPPLLAKAMGHISRIWGIHFLREEASATIPMVLASFGEDGSRITWEVKITTGETGPSRYELEQSHVHPLHTGKNIWSATVDAGRCATGGADGAIALLPSIERIPQTYEISNGLLHGPILDYPKDSYKSYAFVSPDTVVATTANGRIVALTLDQDGTTSVETHASRESLKSFSVVVGRSGVSFVAGIGGSAVMYSLRARQCFSVAEVTGKVAGLFLSKRAEESTLSASEGLSLLVTTVGSSTAQLLDIHTIDHDKAVAYDSTKRPLSIAPGFVVTSFLLIRCGNIEYALLGSRKGVLNIYQIPDTKDREAIAPIQSLQSCHGKESITAMRWKADVNSDGTSGHLFSTGRDGTYAVHRATNRDSTLSLELVHQPDLPFGPSIEGMAFTADSHLRIWGFGGQNFIAHDATTQQDVLTVRCGGRVNLNWAYDPDEHSIGGGGTFVWTQSSTLMRRTQSELPHYTIHPGGHGREIKAVAVSAGKHQIVATGAEDTDIKLFAYSSASGFKCLQTLRKHNTGIQHLAWSVDSRHLFSSAGSEEFYVWRVTRDVPLIGLGVVCESAHPRTRTSDLRIMHFDVREQPAITGRDQEREGGAIFDITMAYSDSTLRRWLYNTSSRTWALQAEGDYLTACLTGVMSLSPRDTNTSLVTTATDGHIAIWNETPTFNDQQSSSSSSLSSTSSSLSWPHRRKIHQNAILASTTRTLHDGSTLLITASDDNGIALSRLSLNPNSDPDVKDLCSTLLIPRAHAAAATALATYRCRKSRSTFSPAAAATDADEQEDTFYLLSASIDQRVKAWEVSVDLTTAGNGSSGGGGAESVKVRKVQNVYTSVADVSCMSLLRLNSNDDDDGEAEGSVVVLVCGVGMDVWRM
jgi:WD40 repeat protein